MIDSSKTTVLFTDISGNRKIVAEAQPLNAAPFGLYKHILTKDLDIYVEHQRTGDRIHVGTLDSKQAEDFFANNKETMEVKIQFKGEEQ